MAAAPQQQQFKSADQSVGLLSCISRTNLDRLAAAMRIFNIGNAALLMASCVFGFTHLEGSITRFFLVLYIGVFAALLGAFELRVKWTTPIIKRMAGFMFTYWGRSIFLLFCGALNFGTLDGEGSEHIAERLAIGAGVVTCVNALFTCIVLCSHPAFRGDTSAADNPADLSEDQVKLYLAAHPELMHSAAQGMNTEQAPASQPTAADFGAGSSSAATSPVAGGYTPPPVPPARSSNTEKEPVSSASSDSNFAEMITSAPAQPPAAPSRGSSAAPAPAPAQAPAEDNPFAADDNPFA